MLIDVSGRESFLVRVEWDNDWPVVNGGKKITLQSNGPGLYQHDIPVSWKDDFSSSQLELGWYRKSKYAIWNPPMRQYPLTWVFLLLDTPFSVDYSLTERPNNLRLYGGPYTLSVPASPTMFLRKQTHRFCTWETKLSFQPISEHTEAGTVVWWNYFTHSSIGIRKQGDQRIIRFKPSEGDVIEATLDPTGDVVLIIECGNEYRFGCRDPSSEETIWIGSVANHVATKAPPVGAPFTGMNCMKFSERL